MSYAQERLAQVRNSIVGIPATAKTLRLEQAAALLGISPATLRKRVAAGIVPAYKPGRALVFITEELIEVAQRSVKKGRPIACDPRRRSENDRRNARNARRRQDLRPKVAEYYSWYRASQKLRTPSWTDRGAIRALYEMARRATDCTGIEFHVDHIYPLHGKEVSGLHVPENMRVFPGLSNKSKGNRLDC